MNESGPTPKNRAPAAGLYLHIPFCLKKCPYCDFYSLSAPERHEDFLSALKTEMALAADFPARFDTLYLGGGTPTILAVVQIEGLLDAARRHFTLLEDAEITIEANPGTLSRGKLAALRRAGVNRLSLGMQSLNDHHLAFLGRLHNSEQARQAVAWSRQAGFERLGLDLIYGLPGQSSAAWREALSLAADLAPEHLSCYLLTVEEGTPFAREQRQGRLSLPGNRLQAHLFETTRLHLERLGYEQYEIANFARRDSQGFAHNRSRHNLKYWSGEPYLGLGPSAHSHLAARRWWNMRDLDGYLSTLGKGQRPVVGEELLEQEARMLEAIYLGLRQSTGIDLDRFGALFGHAEWKRRFGPLLAELSAEGHLRMEGRRCSLAPTARVLLDAVVARFAIDPPTA